MMCVVQEIFQSLFCLLQDSSTFCNSVWSRKLEHIRMRFVFLFSEVHPVLTQIDFFFFKYTQFYINLCNLDKTLLKKFINFLDF